jgi:hypothetical protein
MNDKNIIQRKNIKYIMILKKVVKVEKETESFFIKNQLKENNKKTKREISTCEIIKKIPNWEISFFIINDYQETFFQQDHELFFFNNKNTNFILLKYRINKNYNTFYFNKDFSIQNISKFIFSFRSILDKIILLQENNIHFIGFNYNNVKINENNDCILCNFENTISTDFDFDFSEFLEENYIFYPIEYHFIKYLFERKINAPTLETIESFAEEWESNMNYIFDENSFSERKNTFIKNFYPFINQKVEKIYNHINKSIHSWSLYGMNILFLYFLYNFFSKNEIIENIIHFITFHINRDTQINEYKLLFEEFIFSIKEEDWKFHFSNYLLLKNHKFLFS